MGRVLIRKIDGFPIEYQSGDSNLGTLTQNIINAGLNRNDYQEQFISKSDYKILEDSKINNPEKTKRDQKRNTATQRIKLKLGLTDSDIIDLKDSL